MDDGNLIDLAAAKGSGQALIGTMFRLMGAEPSAKKRHLMDSTGEFLGLAHDLSDVAYQQIVTGNSAKDDHENGRGKRAVLEQIGALAPTIYVQGSAEDGLTGELSTPQR